MRTIDASQIIDTVARMCIDSNRNLPTDVRDSFARSAAREESPAAREVFRHLTENYELAEQTGSAFVTAVLPFRAFKASDKRYQNYYDRNREGPFCAAYIEPKLALLRQRFAGLRREVGHVD